MKVVTSLFLVIAFFLASSCTPGTGMRYDFPKNLPSVEDQPLPNRPDVTAIPPEKDYSIPMLKGAVAAADGILISPDKVARIISYSIYYNELRNLYERDREIWRETRIIFNERLTQSNLEIQNLQESWLQRNIGPIAFIGGITLGAVLTGAIVFGLKNI